MNYPDAGILFFTKEPVAGQVKTRLIPALGAEGAMNLHCKLIERQLSFLNKKSVCNFELWVDGDPRHPVFEHSFDSGRFTQKGQNLGEKMQNAAQQALDRFSMVVIIGSDCPWLDTDYLNNAFTILSAENEVVIGPADDGGYVLIGMSKCNPEIFSGINWGSDQVFTETIRRLNYQNIPWGELSSLPDIDRPEDLELLKGIDSCLID